MKGTMILVPVDGPAVTTELTGPPELETLKDAVGGYIEPVPHLKSAKLRDGRIVPCVVFCNEDGKRLQLPYNEQANLLWKLSMLRDFNSTPAPDFLVGNVVLLYGDDEFMAEL